MTSLIRLATSKSLTTNAFSDDVASIDPFTNPTWLRCIEFILYFVSTSFIIMSIRKIYNDRWEFFMILRSPLLTMFFICICLLYNIFNLIRYSFPILIPLTTDYVLFLTFSTLRISIIIYTLYVLFFAILQQYTLLNRLNLNTNIRRLLSELIIYSTSCSIVHDNITRTIFIIYNLLLFIIILLIKTYIYNNLLGEYLIIMTPQFLILNVLTFIMYKYQPR
eukprot:155476_1